MSATVLTRSGAASPTAPLDDVARLSPRRLLWRAVRSRRRDLVAASVLYSTHQLGESMVPVVIGATISGAVDHGSWAAIGVWLGVLAADFALLSFSYRFGARASMRAKQFAGHQARMWLTDRVVQPAGGVRHPPGDLLSRSSSDADRVGAFAGIVASTIAAVAVLVVSTVLLVRFSLLLGVMIVAGTVVLLVVQSRVSVLLQRRSHVEQHQQARATALAEDLIRGLRVLKGIGAERAAAQNYAAVSQEAVGAAVHAASSQATLVSVGAMFTGIYLSAIAGVGGWLALDGQLGLGQLVAALGLAQFVIGPMETVSGASAAYARALASAARIHDVLAADPAVPDPTVSGLAVIDSAVANSAVPDSAVTGLAGGGLGAPTPFRLPGATDGSKGAALTFEAVAVSGTARRTAGPSGVRPAQARATRLDARVPAGSMTGLVCGDPAVAAAIPLLLAREHDPDAGLIRLDDTAIALFPLDVLRQAMLVCLHDAVLLPGSIADNLAALTDDPDAIALAARASCADQVVDAAPNGRHTPVGDRGETLSGGQRQRIALARALAARSPVLVLHDPTTAVDAATEDRIAEQVRGLRAGRTTLVITTSPAWLARCDQVIHLHESGCDLGTHTGLLADASAYVTTVAR